jgi:predicted nucleic acid-binding protein
MIVVADSGPLHYLILLGHVDLLQRFYGEVLVPEPVAGELTTASAPDTVREWMTTHRHGSLCVRSPRT